MRESIRKRVGIKSGKFLLQWNLSYADALGTKTIVLISEVSLFQGENNMYLYKIGAHDQSSVPINQLSLFQRCPLRGVPLYHHPLRCTYLLY